MKCVDLAANPVVHAKISGELFDFMRVHSLEHVSTQVNGCLCLISQREIIFKRSCPNFSNGCPFAL